MTNYLKSIKNFVLNVFVQDEGVGLKTIDKVNTACEVPVFKKNSDFKISDIMR